MSSLAAGVRESRSNSNAMITVDCYVDPVCPFSWAATRWLAGIGGRRAVTITYRQMSLAVLNEGKQLDGPAAARIETSRQVGRLVAAAAGDPELFARLYRALGTRIHVSGESLTAELARTALSECGLDPALADAMSDPAWDSVVRDSHQRSQQALGGTAGSPITVFNGHAVFGPVLTAIPQDGEADRLFDALITLSETPSFSEVQRPRSGPPDLTERPGVSGP